MVESDSELDLGESEEEDEEIELIDEKSQCNTDREEDAQDTGREDRKSFSSVEKLKTTKKFCSFDLFTINEEEESETTEDIFCKKQSDLSELEMYFLKLTADHSRQAAPTSQDLV